MLTFASFWIMLLRKEANFSKKEMARFCGAHIRTIEGWEQGLHPSATSWKVLGMLGSTINMEIPDTKHLTVRGKERQRISRRKYTVDDKEKYEMTDNVKAKIKEVKDLLSTKKGQAVIGYESKGQAIGITKDLSIYKKEKERISEPVAQAIEKEQEGNEAEGKIDIVRKHMSYEDAIEDYKTFQLSIDSEAGNSMEEKNAAFNEDLTTMTMYHSDYLKLFRENVDKRYLLKIYMLADPYNPGEVEQDKMEQDKEELDYEINAEGEPAINQDDDMENENQIGEVLDDQQTV